MWGDRRGSPRRTTACRCWGREAARKRRGRRVPAVIDWSYSLLSEDERRFSRALGIFSGGLTAEAAAAVVDEAENTGFNSIDRLAASGVEIVGCRGCQRRQPPVPAARYDARLRNRQTRLERRA